MNSTDDAKKQPAAQEDKLVGSLIELITNAQVRYEGTLVEVDKAERSMKLKSVRSFGTEGRRGGVNEVDAQEQEFPVVIFKVDHIKDFKIVKRREDLPKQPQKVQEQDPAIISAQEPKQEIKKEEKPKEERKR
jgi:protein LSM14